MGQMVNSNSNGPIKILYLEDDYVDRTLMRMVLRKDTRSPLFDFIAVETLEEARAVLASGKIDIFITDNRLPCAQDFHATLAQLEPIDDEMKIVIVSSEIESRCFRNLQELSRRPDAIVDKSTLKSRITEELF